MSEWVIELVCYLVSLLTIIQNATDVFMQLRELRQCGVIEIAEVSKLQQAVQSLSE